MVLLAWAREFALVIKDLHYKYCISNNQNDRNKGMKVISTRPLTVDLKTKENAKEGPVEKREIVCMCWFIIV